MNTTGFHYRETFALVTGASSGLGKACAEELAARGAHLVLVARSRLLLESLATTLRRAHGVRVEVLQADLSDATEPARIVHALEQRGIAIDLLLNNAGLGYSGRFLNRPLKEALEPLAVNVHSLVSLTHLLGSRMMARGRGGILSIGSIGAFQPNPYNACYGATKAFVLLFTESLAEEWKGSGVRVMVANPGAIATGFFAQSPTTMTDRQMDTAASVAKRMLDDFARGKVVSYPGRPGTRLVTLLNRVLPRSVTVSLSGRVSRGMGFDR